MYLNYYSVSFSVAVINKIDDIKTRIQYKMLNFHFKFVVYRVYKFKSVVNFLSPLFLISNLHIHYCGLILPCMAA